MLQRIVGTAVTALAGAILFAVPAHASIVVTPTIQGSGTVADVGSNYSCTFPTASDTAAHTCTPPSTGHIVTKGPLCGITPNRCTSFSVVSLTPTAATGWHFVGWDPNTVPVPCAGATTCQMTGSGADNDDTSYTPLAIFRQTIETTFTAKPPAFSNRQSATITYVSPVGTSYLCKIDGVSQPCGAAQPDHSATSSLANLADGPHSIEVTGVSAPNTSDTPATYSWTVDTAAPTASIDPTSGPGQGALQTIATETFRFGSSEPGGAFLCSLDGAAFGACPATTTLTGLAAGAHSLRVEAVDKAGNVSVPVERDWTVVTPDADGDGFNANVDCNDADPTVHPGGTDVPGNRKDENCDGSDAPVVSAGRPVEQIQAVLAFAFKASRSATKFTKLQVKNVPFGSTVHVACAGSGCPKGLKGKGFTKQHAFGTVDLKRFIKHPFRASTALTVRVSKPGAINAIKVMRVRPGKPPLITTRCQPPGAKKPVSC